MAASGSCGTGMTWVVSDDGTLTISGNGAISFTTQPWTNYVDLISTIVIDEGVTSICKECFNNLSSVEEVHFPSTVTSVLKSAFKGCYKIERLYIADLAKYVEKVTFSNYASMPHYVSSNGVDLYIDGVLVTTLVIPSGVKKTHDYFVYKLKSITDIELPDTLITIGHHSFMECANLRKVVIPDSVTDTGSYSFQNCQKLKEIVLGNGVTAFNVGFGIGLTGLEKLSIGSGMTQNNPASYLNQCTSLETVVISENNATYALVDGIIYTKDLTSALFIPISKLNAKILDTVTVLHTALYSGRSSLTTYTIPNAVITLGFKCFEECTGLQRIRIHKNVGQLGGNCFKGCTSLTEVIVDGYIPPAVSPDNGTSGMMNNGSFYGCTSLTEIKVPIGTGEAYKASTGWSSYAHLIIESEEAGYDDPPTDPDPEPDLPVEPDIPTFDHTSMILGWIVGRRMRVLRGSASQNGS